MSYSSGYIIFQLVLFDSRSLLSDFKEALSSSVGGDIINVEHFEMFKSCHWKLNYFGLRVRSVEKLANESILGISSIRGEYFIVQLGKDTPPVVVFPLFIRS